MSQFITAGRAKGLGERAVIYKHAFKNALIPTMTIIGISFAILYTLFEQMNWPLFTYHPAVGKLDFWMQRARSGEGPGMYWYGWLFPKLLPPPPPTK